MNEQRSTRIIANWIFLGVGMLIIQVLLGGITRLTGSGLSITEWKPIMGALPPMNESDWQQSFDRYQQIAQYKYMNSQFTLADYKFIFFWEWLHRVWARLIGVVFLLPFIYFLAKRYFKQWMINPLIILFLLGALQGVIGWLMVKSGLNDENVYVNHIRLAIHFVSAMVLICYALVFGWMLIIKPEERITDPSLRKFTFSIIAVLAVQLFYGAFMAGLKAAPAAATWPTINGMIIPTTMFRGDILHDLFFDPITIHFIHRTLAYVLFVLIIAWWWKARRQNFSAPFRKARIVSFLLVWLQVILGILAVLNSTKIVRGHFGVFEWLAQVHQLTGMLLLLSLITAFYLLRTGRKRL